MPETSGLPLIRHKKARYLLSAERISCRKGAHSMAKLKYIDKQGQVSVRLKLSSSERINNNEVMFFSRDFSRGFMRPIPEDSSKILFTGARGIALSKFLKRSINKDHFYMMIAQLLEAYKAVMHYKLHPAKVVLDLDFIIINENTGELYLIYQPVLNSPALNKGFMTCFGQIASMAKFGDPNDRANVNNFMNFAGGLPSFSVNDLEGFIMSASPVTYTIVPRQNYTNAPAPQASPAQPVPMGGPAPMNNMGGAPLRQPDLSQNFMQGVPQNNMGGMPQNPVPSRPAQSVSFMSDMETTYADADQMASMPAGRPVPPAQPTAPKSSETVQRATFSRPDKEAPEFEDDLPPAKNAYGQTPKKTAQNGLSVPNALRPAGDLFDDLIDDEEPKAELVKEEAPVEVKAEEPKAEPVKEEAPVEVKAEEPKAEPVKEEAPVEVKAEEPKAEPVKEEAPVEVKPEEPKAETVKEEAPVEVKAEEPKAEPVKEEAPVEVKSEEPKAEPVKEEAPVEVKAEEPKAEPVKEEAPVEVKPEEPKAEPVKEEAPIEVKAEEPKAEPVKEEAPVEVKAEEPKAEPVKGEAPVEVKPEEPKAEPVKEEAPVEVKPEEPKAEPVKEEAPVEVKPEEPKAEPVKEEAPVEVKAEEPKAEPVKEEAPVEVKAEEPKAEPVKEEAPVEVKAEEPKAEPVKEEAPVEVKAEEPKADDKKKHGHKVLIKPVKVKAVIRKAADNDDDEPPTTVVSGYVKPADKAERIVSKPGVDAAPSGPPPIPFTPKRNDPATVHIQPPQDYNYADQFSAEDEGTVVLSDYNRPSEQEAPPAKIVRRSTNETVLVNKHIFTIGKERAKVDYCVTNNKTVSRSHATIYRRGEGYFIVDNNSTNGTFVNNSRIPAQTEIKLNNGDLLRLSNEEFDFRED